MVRRILEKSGIFEMMKKDIFKIEGNSLQEYREIALL